MFFIKMNPLGPFLLCLLLSGVGIGIMKEKNHNVVNIHFAGEAAGQ